jgi:hypothetical protein
MADETKPFDKKITTNLANGANFVCPATVS